MSMPTVSQPNLSLHKLSAETITAIYGATISNISNKFYTAQNLKYTAYQSPTEICNAISTVRTGNVR